MNNRSRVYLAATGILIAGLCVATAGERVAKESIAHDREDTPVHPITAPYWNEDSFVTTDLRPVYVYHAFPGEILGGKQASVTALQLRIALTKSLQLVAYKAGCISIRRGSITMDGTISRLD